MADVKLQNVAKSYREKKTNTPVEALHDLSFSCVDGEFLVLLGPSGCGKTSTLRIIAGLEDHDVGHIFIRDRCVDDLSPKERNIAMAFENYALYPPLTVLQNLVFPLKARGKPKHDIDRKLTEVVEILEIGDILDRRPSELSGGQQQRVSLGRCIISDADVYLMDEPLSHIDTEVRLRTRSELKRLQALKKRTVIYVTHDQIEALVLADRIAVLENGVLQQIGTPMEIYNNPANLFVAGFIGEPAMNFIHGRISMNDSKAFFTESKGHLKVPLTSAVPPAYQSNEVILGIRPDFFHLEDPQLEDSQYMGEVVVYESLGEEGILEVKIMDCQLIAQTDPDLHIQSKDKVRICIDWQMAVLFDVVSGLALSSFGGG